MARIHEFFIGHCSHPECAVVKGGGFKPRQFPARAWLIECRGKHILWDTGYAQHFFQQARGVYRLYAAVTPVTLEEGTGLLEQLEAQGVLLTDIDALVLSHFHADHVAGVADFPGVPLFAAAQAWESIDGVSGLRALLRGHIPGLVPRDLVDLQARNVESLPAVDLPVELHPFQHAWQLDPDVLCVSLPGHARGHLGAFIRLDDGSWELLASDAAWDPLAYKALRGPSEISFLIQHSREQYYQTLHKLQQLHLKGIRIRLSHEPRETV
jgi:glyoxylase-like metal-dependent hydrolase (beta-lactamase superfamily II)